MFEVSSDWRWRLPDDETDAADSALAAILRNWLFAAAIAWAGYEREGRGTVVVDADGCARYRPGSICACHEELVAQYDPERQAVVALVDPDGIQAVHIVTGWPAPPDAALVTPGERVRLTAH